MGWLSGKDLQAISWHVSFLFFWGGARGGTGSRISQADLNPCRKLDLKLMIFLLPPSKCQMAGMFHHARDRTVGFVSVRQAIFCQLSYIPSYTPTFLFKISNNPLGKKDSQRFLSEISTLVRRILKWPTWENTVLAVKEDW